jgi:hypothetical protein
VFQLPNDEAGFVPYMHAAGRVPRWTESDATSQLAEPGALRGPWQNQRFEATCPVNPHLMCIGCNIYLFIYAKRLRTFESCEGASEL